MENYKREFIRFMLEEKVLRFGEFTLKSGRKSPFFMNAGLYQTGHALNALGEFYARAIAEKYGTDFDLLFGPAYKGIPLAVATVAAFDRLYGKQIRYVSNRKEAKDHGDVGGFLGAVPKDGDRIVIIEDVTTSGASMAETVPLLRAAGSVEILGLMVSLDRMEQGRESAKSALSEIKSLYGFDTGAIVTMQEVREFLEDPELAEAAGYTEAISRAMDAYYAQYGARE